MPRKGHSPDQVVQALSRVRHGEPVGTVCRKMGISEATFYNWKKQYAGDLHPLAGPAPPVRRAEVHSPGEQRPSRNRACREGSPDQTHSAAACFVVRSTSFLGECRAF